MIRPESYPDSRWESPTGMQGRPGVDIACRGSWASVPRLQHVEQQLAGSRVLAGKKKKLTSLLCAGEWWKPGNWKVLSTDGDALAHWRAPLERAGRVVPPDRLT